MAIRKVEAFVLKRMLFRESSLLVTLFSKEVGKLKVLAKGVRKEKKSSAAYFEPFTRLSLVYYEKLKSDIHLASETSVLDSSSFLRARLDYFSYASYLIDLVDTLFGFYDPHPDAFDLLAQAFSFFQSVPLANVARVFEVKLLEQVGWLPVLNHCAVCGETGLERVFFSPQQGGILCAKCELKEPRTLPLSPKTLESLHFFLKNSFAESVKYRIDLQTERELERAAERFIEFRIEYPLSSKRFLSELNSLQRK